MSQAPPSVQLQPPGAGLPPLELALSRLGISVLCRTTSRARASRLFAREGERILALARSLPLERAARQVLIPRIWGIEDSSRNWSVLMVLDHLLIVNTAIAELVEHLAAGKAYGKATSIADVKPRPEQDASVIDRFAQCLADYPRRIDDIANLRTAQRYPHPWFGPMNAHDWHCLAAFHHRIHRRQTQRIIGLLGSIDAC